MKQVIKYALVGFAGYIIGFYEMKYKLMTALIQKSIENDENSK